MVNERHECHGEECSYRRRVREVELTEARTKPQVTVLADGSEVDAQGGLYLSTVVD